MSAILRIEGQTFRGWRVRKVVTMIGDVTTTKTTSMHRAAKETCIQELSGMFPERPHVLLCNEHGWTRENNPDFSSLAPSEIIPSRWHEWLNGLRWYWWRFQSE
jgi:hypothetical protein